MAVETTSDLTTVRKPVDYLSAKIDRKADLPSEVESLLRDLVSHETSERDMLQHYRDAATKSDDGGVRFLMGLILDDEERHRQLIEAMATEVRDSIQWSDHQALPSIRPREGSRRVLLEQTESFLNLEKHGLEDLKVLQHKVKDLHSGLMQLIVEGMIADTRKHVEMLDYIRKQLQG